MKSYNPLKKILLFLLPLFIVLCSLVPLPKIVFTGLLLVLLILWIFSFLKEESFVWADLPLLVLIGGAFMNGKAFSIIGFESLGLPLYITEITIAACIIMLLVKERSPQTLWQSWTSMLPKGLLPAMAVYFMIGSLYIVLGYFANGMIALRDIVFCHYMLILLFTLSLVSRLPKPGKLFRLFTPLIIILFLFGLTSFFVRVPSTSAFRQYIKITKMMSLSLSSGMLVIFCLSFFGSLKKNHKKIAFIIAVCAFLLVIVAEVRAGWVGMIAALILLTILLKKEMKVILLLLAVVAGSLWTIDHFGLTIRKNKLSDLSTQIKTISKPTQVTLPGANIKWRLGIWSEIFREIKIKPILGWGFGVQVDYIIWGIRLSQYKAEGRSTGIVPAHNHLLAITHKMGIVGLLLFLFINARIFFYGTGYLKLCNSDFHRRLLVAALTCLLYWHGMAFFFDILESPPTGIFLWILLGTILAVIHKDKKENISA